MKGSRLRRARAWPRRLLGRAAAALALVVPTACGPGEEPALTPVHPPDVVLIVIDTLRADRLGCYGYHRDTTPTIDALAARGARFERAHAQSSWTGPSMVSLLLSRHVAADFVRMPPPPSLAERLRAVGYRTAGFQDNVLLDPDAGFGRGFDLYEMEPPPASVLRALAPGPKPLFLYFHFVEPHDPYAPFEQFDLFDPEPVEEPTRRAFAEHLAALDPAVPPAERERRLATALAEVQAERARYDGDVRQADSRVQFVVRALRAAGRLERALIVVAADHGESLWQHEEAQGALDQEDAANPLRRFKKTHNTVLYESLTRTPLILAGPGVPQGIVVAEAAQNVDIGPTLFELLGLPLPTDAWDGRSFVGAMQRAERGEPAASRRLTFANTRLFTSALSPEGLKLIQPWDPSGPDPARLHDLSVDPGERLRLPLSGPAYEALAEAIRAFRRDALLPEAGEDELDEATRARLEQLGYVR